MTLHRRPRSRSSRLPGRHCGWRGVVRAHTGRMCALRGAGRAVSARRQGRCTWVAWFCGGVHLGGVPREDRLDVRRTAHTRQRTQRPVQR